MDQFGAGDQVEQLTVHVVRRAVTGGTEVDLARILFFQGDQFLDGFCRD